MNIQSHKTFVKFYSKPMFDAWFGTYSALKQSHLIFIKII